MSSEPELGEMSSTINMKDQCLTLLVIGKTGNGKSSVGNTIFGQDVFHTGRSMSSTTVRSQRHCGRSRDGRFTVQVVDTPDVTNNDFAQQALREEVERWKSWTNGRPSAVLLVIRCDVRYTQEEYAIYWEFLRLWEDKSIKNRLVIVFTFGDRQDQDIHEELKSVCKELQSVLNDASKRYVVFDNTTKDEDQLNDRVHELMMTVQMIKEPETITKELKVIFAVLCITGIGFAASVTNENEILSYIMGLGFFGTLVAAIWKGGCNVFRRALSRLGWG